MRTQQIAGALTRLTEMTTQYAQDRVQFGRPIGKFQAVQQNLAVLAGQTAAAVAGADLAAEAVADGIKFFRSRRGRRGLARRPGSAPRSRTRCMAPSASPSSTACIFSPAACGRGAMNSATTPPGTGCSAATWPRPAPIGFGRR